MTHFLLVYDRPRGLLLREQPFDDRREALQARFAAEREFRGRESEIEVVVIGSVSREELVQSHGRYFLSLDQLLARFQRIVQQRFPAVAQ